jgi:hypothetical protein
MDKLRPTVGSFGLIAMIACSAATIDSSPPGTPLQITRLRAEPYSFTSASGFDQPARLVISDPTTWATAWQQTFKGSLPVPPVPDVDFSREVIVLAALGSHSTGGYGILVEGASATDTGTSIEIRSISPGSNCVTTQAFTQPVDIARVPRRDGPVAFIEHKEVHNCS